MNKKLNLNKLTALVLSSMLGTGIFSLPQNVAEVASPAALFISWIITGIGVISLLVSILVLTNIRPNINEGIFAYARDGFGELIGFCSAWGYWFCIIIANSSYLIITFSALSLFNKTTMLIFGKGNTSQSIIGASVLLWLIHWLALNGIHKIANINLITTITKLIPIILFIILAILKFKLDIFSLDFTGISLGIPMWKQVKNTLLVTLWAFIGVEGAFVISNRVYNKRDAGYAALLAVSLLLLIYMLVTLLSLGIVPRQELANMDNPSIARLMLEMTGSWGKLVAIVGFIISVCSAYLSWTIIAAEVPLLITSNKTYPCKFKFQNKKHTSSSITLWLTNISVQICLILIWMTNSSYNIILAIASEMVLVPYFLIGAYLLKISVRKFHYFIGTSTCIYSLWLMVSSDPMYLLISLMLYIPGLIIFTYFYYMK